MVKAGDLILITKTFLDCGMYSIGDVLEVDKVFKGCVRTKDVDVVIGIDEFEVIQDGLSQHLCETAVVGSVQRAS